MDSWGGGINLSARAWSKELISATWWRMCREENKRAARQGNGSTSWHSLHAFQEAGELTEHLFSWSVLSRNHHLPRLETKGISPYHVFSDSLLSDPCKAHQAHRQEPSTEQGWHFKERMMIGCLPARYGKNAPLKGTEEISEHQPDISPRSALHQLLSCSSTWVKLCRSCKCQVTERWI